MNLLGLPWLEIAVVVALIGACGPIALRNARHSFRWGLFFSVLVLGCTIIAWIGARLGTATSPFALFGARFLTSDPFGTSLAAMTALLYFLTVIATGRTKMRKFSIAWSLASEAIQIALFGCADPWALIVLISIGSIPPYFVLRSRNCSTQVYIIHMALFVALLFIGWALVSTNLNNGVAPAWAIAPLLGAILIRCGTIPVHCWLTDWFEQASFGNALLFVAPLTGVYAAVRLVLPVAPEWVLEAIGIISLLTAIYAGGMAAIQVDVRRFFAHLFLSQASLVLVGLELHTPVSLTGALSLWLSVTLALGGLGLTLRALEARVGRLSLGRFNGLYEHVPALAVCFLLTGLASVGFPGTIGFVAMEMLVDGAVHADLILGIGVVLAAALNGIAVVRAYLLLFTGTRHVSTISLKVGVRERIAVFTLAALILIGGLFPQSGAAARHNMSEAILRNRTDKPPMVASDDPNRGRPQPAPHQ